MHKSRKNRKINEAKSLHNRNEVFKKLDQEEINKRVEYNRLLKESRYPTPPVYSQPKFGENGRI